jgi:O-antigen ligase
LSTAFSFLGLIFLILNKLTYDNRLTTIFNSPNYYAISLAPGIIICFWILFSKNFLKSTFSFINSKLVIYSIFLILLSHLISFFFTKSLGGWLGIWGSLLTLYLITKEKVNFLNLVNKIIYILIFSFFCFLFLSPLLFKKLDYSPFMNRSSLDSRLVIYQVSTKLIQHNWFLGIGPSNYQTSYLSHQEYFLPYPQWAVPHPHNIYLNIWLEAGLLGLLGLILLVIQINKINDTRINNIDSLFFVILIYFLLHGLFDTVYWKNDLSILFFTMLFFNIRLKNK